MNISRFAMLAVAASLVAAPALAQTDPGTSSSPGAPGKPGVGTAPSTNAGGMTAGSSAGGMDNGAMLAGGASHNPILTTSGDVRTSQVVGTSVYNDKNEKIGSVDDILLGKDQKAESAVLSVGGVLGVGAKLVQVPFDKLQFPHDIDSKTARIVMPGGSASALTGMPEFHYASN